MSLAKKRHQKQLRRNAKKRAIRKSTHMKTIRAKEGRVVIWPAFWTHFHNGIVSKTQTKYIATGWFMYDRIPDSRDKTSKGSLFADLFQNPYNLTGSV